MSRTRTKSEHETDRFTIASRLISKFEIVQQFSRPKTELFRFYHFRTVPILSSQIRFERETASWWCTDTHIQVPRLLYDRVEENRFVCLPHGHTRELREFFKYETSLVIMLSLYMFQFTMLFTSWCIYSDDIMTSGVAPLIGLALTLNTSLEFFVWSPRAQKLRSWTCSFHDLWFKSV